MGKRRHAEPVETESADLNAERVGTLKDLFPDDALADELAANLALQCRLKTI
jgi:hypothetical protein